jgi:putative ABC transport system permease protein
MPMSRNLRYAVRSLSKDRGFAAMVALSLAVGIGANTAIFSLVNGVLLRPLDYREPERLVAISQASPQFLKLYPALPINIATWLEWRRQSSPFESVGAYRNTALSLTGSGQPELIEGAAVSANFFHVLGVAPRLGREFLDSEDRSGQDQVVIIADSLWRRRFRADPGIVGRKIMLDAKPFLVIAVLPPDFQFPKQEDDIGTHSNGRMEIYRTLGYEPDDTVLHGGDLNYWPVARLRPGISITRASAELNSEEAAIDAKTDADFRATIVPLQDKLTGNIRQSLIVLMGAVGAVLLVLCVNLANLSLARAAGRARDSAIRTALGASRGQLLRQSLMESGVLSAIGGAGGILLAYWGVRWLLAAAPIDLPRRADVHLDSRVLLFALAISLATGLIFGILPALRSAASRNPFETLKAGSRTSTEGRGGINVRNILVGLEVGLSAALLVTAGLLIASFVRLTTIDKGFDVERVLAVDVRLPAAKYPNPEQRAEFFQRVLDQARALPGVESASLSSYLPLQGESWIDVVKTENDARPEAQLPTTNIRFVSPGFFKTLHIALRAGRDFEPGDRSRMVAVISAALAQKLWPGLDPVGRKLNDNGRVHEVVGVAADVRSTSLDQDPVNMLYIPYWQRTRFSSSILVRTGMDPAGIASALRAAIWSVDAEAPVPEERTLDQVMSESVARRRFQMLLVLLFAAAALALAAFGTYGVVSYAVTRRRAELGIRMALGAQRGDVLRMVLRQGMTPVFAGLCAGAVAALGIGQYVASLLFQVSPRDPAAFGIAAATLLAVSAAACLIPARRATRVNPVDALRFD